MLSITEFCIFQNKFVMRMGNPIYKVFVGIGLVFILHAAYSAAQHRTFLRLSKTEFVCLPLDIALQCLVALGVVAFGVINVAGDLKEIRVTAELEKQSFETVWNNPSFYAFSHRGKALFAE
jgi:hypothetical protein